MIRSKKIFLPVSPSPPNHITQQGFLAKLCPIFALSAISCRVNTTVGELECSCLSAKLCHFWRPFHAESDTFLQSCLGGLCTQPPSEQVILVREPALFLLGVGPLRR